MNSEQERLLNHADAEQIASMIEEMAGVVVGRNDGDIGELPSHDDGTRIINAVQKLKVALENRFGAKVDKVEGKELSTNDFTNEFKSKLEGIENGAEVNIQADWDVSDSGEDSFIQNKPTLGTAAAKDATNSITEDSTDLIESGSVYTGLSRKIDLTQKGTANGVAELDANGTVPASQLPSYVDDILEYDSISNFPQVGETGKIYVAKDSGKTYRWSGTGYVEISESLALGETSSTAYAGNKGKANADAIQAIKDGSVIDSFADVENALDGKVDKVTGKGLSTNDYTTNEKDKLSGIESGAQVNAVDSVAGKTGNVTLDKTDVGLDNVGNFKAVSTVANQGLSTTEQANARANIGAGSSTFTGDYNDLTNKPALGTAASKDVPSSGNASAAQVVKGDDTRLTDSRPASDVPSWAKASTKPSYAYSEITGEPEQPSNTTFGTNTVTETYTAGNKVTTFNNNGTISETMPSGDIYLTTFNSDGSITRTKQN